LNAVELVSAGFESGERQRREVRWMIVGAIQSELELMMVTRARRLLSVAGIK
jgi:hypothetical protein